MKLTPFKAVYPDLDKVEDHDDFFGSVKQDFPIMAANAMFLQDDDECLYLYDIVTTKMIHSGLVGCVSINDYLDGRIMRHEHTIAPREQRMKDLFLQRNALIKPVLVTYKRDKKADKVMQRVRERAPFFQMVLDGGDEHLIYKISDPEDISRLQDRFKKRVAKAYIADGHHRCVTSARLYETMQGRLPNKDFSQVLCMLMPFEDIVIHDYNRVVEILLEFSPTLFMAQISQLCHITPIEHASKPKRKYEMTMYLFREWYHLRWKKSVLKRYASQDVILDGDLLNREVLGGILGITDLREDSRLTYVQGMHGIEGIERKADKSIFRIAFCLYPVAMDEIIKVTENNKTLPPKSTWFEPRIKNGVLCKSFES